MAAVLLVPTGAQACSCGHRDMQSSLDAGYAIAVVTRTDTGPTGTGGDEAATFRLEGAVGPALPDQVTGVLDYCQGPVAPGGVEALVFQPRRTVQVEEVARFLDPGPGDPEELVLGTCSNVDVGAALHRIRGAPTTSGEGPAVALAWGSYDDRNWLAAVDSQGRVAAWDEQGGWNVAVGTCPGGKVAVVASRSDESDRYTLSVRDVSTLQTRREVALLTEDSGESRSRVVRIAPDGTRKVLGRFAGAAEFAASPDGRMIAVSDGTGALVAIDARTGRRLARWVPPRGGTTAVVGWASRGPLAVTNPSYTDRRPRSWSPSTPTCGRSQPAPRPERLADGRRRFLGHLQHRAADRHPGVRAYARGGGTAARAGLRRRRRPRPCIHPRSRQRPPAPDTDADRARRD